MECCICYNKNGIYNTYCNHNICLNCLTKLQKPECPYCRQKLNLPENIEKIIKSNYSKLDYNNITTGNLIIPENITNILNEIKEVSEYHYNQIINSINNGHDYDESYLRELYHDLYREKVNISRINSLYFT